MKKFIDKYGNVLVAFALIITNITINYASICIPHQKALSKNAKNLHKL